MAKTSLPVPDPELYAAAERLAQQEQGIATSGHVYAGTAGWTDRTLIKDGRFYPRSNLSPAERLSFYAQHFALVEVDATYYTLVSAELTRRWAEATPSGFRFDVKAHPVFTGHPLDIRRLPPDIRQSLGDPERHRIYPERVPSDVRTELEQRFVLSLEPLIEQGKLASVLLQFPPWFHATRGNARRIERLAEQFGERLPLSVEFRHPSWLSDERRTRVLELLKQHGMSYVCVDEPHTSTSGVPPVIAVTNSKLSILRFHGQNVSGWQRRGASVEERFNYLYSPTQLERWLPAVRRLSEQAEEVHTVFNNCVRNYAVLNAKGLAVLLERKAGVASA